VFTTQCLALNDHGTPRPSKRITEVHLNRRVFGVRITAVDRGTLPVDVDNARAFTGTMLRRPARGRDATWDQGCAGFFDVLPEVFRETRTER
jgi:hypothetical protein